MNILGIPARRIDAAPVGRAVRLENLSKTPVTSMSSTQTELTGAPFVVAALYKFVDLTAEEVETVQGELETLCEANHLQGTLLLAKEGLNGTVAGSAHAVDSLDRLSSQLALFCGHRN